MTLANPKRQKVSVVVCARNEESRIALALEGIKLNNPDEIVVIDDDSSDATVQIARRFTDKVILSKARSLTTNRQIGIDETRNDLIAMIDADHILSAGDLDRLVDDLDLYKFDIVQGQLASYGNVSVWNSAEEAAWQLTHNIAGPRRMIGASPTVYRRAVFGRMRFEGSITKNNDDAPFIYRLSKLGEFRYGIGDTKIRQFHFPELRAYLKKFMWYGELDGEFMHKYPRHAHAHLFHLLVRYPLIYSAKAICRRRFRAIPFFVVQGTVRFIGILSYCLKVFVLARVS